MMRRNAATAVALAGFVVAVGLLLPAGVAFADDPPSPPPMCFSADPQTGDPPTCTYEGGKWSIDNSTTQDGPFTQDSGSSGGGFVVAGMVVALVLGIGVTVWRVGMARRIATDAGLDPNAAATATLLGTGGLTATYLAANLHPHPGSPDGPPVHHVSPSRSPQARLTELKQLKDEGLITEDEYDRRRTAVVDSV